MKKGTLILSMLAFVASCRSEIAEIRVKVDGIHCDYCAYSLGKHLTKLPDVQSAAVDRSSGTASMIMAGNEKLELSQIEKSLKYTPFSVRGIDIIARGNIEKRGSHYFFKVEDNPYRIYLMQNDKLPKPKAKKRKMGFTKKMAKSICKLWDSAMCRLSSEKKLEKKVLRAYGEGRPAEIRCGVHNHCDGFLGLASNNIKIKSLDRQA